MIAGIAVLALLALAMLAVLMTRDPGTGAGSPTPIATGSATPAPTGSESGASATPVRSDGPSPTPGAALELLSVVRPTVDGVTLRESPTTEGEQLGTLARGSDNIVIEGPVAADGYSWYRLAATGLPPSSGCVTPLPTDPLECPVWYGWAAAGDPERGEAWFEASPPDCPDPVDDTTGFMSLPYRLPLACYREPISFTAWYPDGGDPPEGECDTDAPEAWLYCNRPGITVWPTEDDSSAAAYLQLVVDPSSGVTLPDPDQWVRLTGGFDHPAAPGCADANADAGLYEEDHELAALECRTRFVVSAVEVTSAP